MDRRESLKLLGGAGAAALGGYGAYTVFLRDDGSQTPARPDYVPADGEDGMSGDDLEGTRKGNLLLGVSPSERDLSVLAPFERWLGKRHAVVGNFVDMGQDADGIDYVVNGLMETTWRRGHVPHVFWQPYLPSREETSQEICREIAQGQHDQTLQAWAEALAEWATVEDGPDRRCYINFAPEMNGDWAEWSPAIGDVTEEDFVAMWQHVHDVVHGTALEDDHVQWMWTLDTTTRGVDRQAVYPGDDYVDWTAIHGYNWINWGAWLTPQETYGDTLEVVRSIADKPVAITELGCSAETSGDDYDPERKDQWIAKAYEYFEENDVKMTLWFNVRKETDWAVFDARPGADTVTVRDTEYQVYPEYREAVNPASVLGVHPNEERLLTDEEFTGQF